MSPVSIALSLVASTSRRWRRNNWWTWTACEGVLPQIAARSFDYSGNRCPRSKHVGLNCWTRAGSHSEHSNGCGGVPGIVALYSCLFVDCPTTPRKHVGSSLVILQRLFPSAPPSCDTIWARSAPFIGRNCDFNRRARRGGLTTRWFCVAEFEQFQPYSGLFSKIIYIYICIQYHLN